MKAVLKKSRVKSTGATAAKPAAGAKAKKAKLVKSELAFKGKVFNVYRDTVIEPGGHENVREVIRHNGSVVILAVDESVNPADPDDATLNRNPSLGWLWGFLPLILVFWGAALWPR